MTKYTIEQFVEDFEDAQTPDAKQSVLLTLLDSDVDVVEHKELLKEYKEQIQDLKDQLDIEGDAVINIEIEQGFVKLYTCTKSVGNYAKTKSIHSFYDSLNYGHIYMINDVIKVKCISELAIHCNDIKLGEVYMCNKTTSKDYYFIHKIQMMLPSELFIPLGDWREQIINEIIK